MPRPITSAPRRNDAATAWLLLSPCLVGLALFDMAPVVSSVVDSFRSFNPYTLKATGWNFPMNYLAAAADPFFGASILNTFLYLVLTPMLTMPAALAMALLVHRRFPLSNWLRNVIVAAMAISEAVAASIWDQLFESGTGLLNAMLVALHLPAQRFLNSPDQALICIVVMSVWKSLGLPMLILLAGLQAVPPETEEAAALEGAGAWTVLTRITLPQISMFVALATFVTVLTASRILAPVVMLTQGGPNWSTTNLSFYIYAQNFSYSSPGTAAVGVVGMLGLLSAAALVQLFAMKHGRGGR